MKTILLVEDTRHLAEEIGDILRLEGFHVLFGSNAVNALEILSGTTPDLIITDLLMPVMDGFEFIRHVRAMPPLAGIPIIILSAKTSPEDKLLGMAVGASAYVNKPCKAHELIARINTFI